MSASSDTRASTIVEQAAEWWVRLQDQHSLSTDEGKAFDRWIEVEAHAQAFRNCAETWAVIGTVAEAPEIVARRVDALEALRSGNRRRWARPGRGWLGIPVLAATIIVAVCFGLVAWTLRAGHGDDVRTAVGERRTILLVDGSRMSLDGRTEVSVDVKPDQRRLRIAEGRARFDVAHESKRPFTVEAGGRIVIATGTSFSTELINNALHVIVYEGQVAVLDGPMPANDRLLSLKRDPGGATFAVNPGQELILNATTGAVLRHDNPGSAAWETGQLEFVDQPLSDAVAQLNRHSTNTIEIRDPRAAKIRVNGVFRAGNSEGFLNAIAKLYPVTVHRSGRDRTQIRYRS